RLCLRCRDRPARAGGIAARRGPLPIHPRPDGQPQAGGIRRGCRWGYANGRAAYGRAAMTEAQRELWNERAAILEFEAGLSREESERRARVEVMGDNRESDCE